MGVRLDVIVTPAEGTWNLADLLGRSMGRIAKTSREQFVIHPEGNALETMSGLNRGPHASLDAALAEIEKHTRGACRRNAGEDQSSLTD
jgi:hypothetical protein